MWVLLAVAVVIVGFALRLNAMLVVTVAGWPATWRSWPSSPSRDERR
ncbi:MAG: 5-oxoproline transporter, DUF969 family subunit [Oryzihumus sp.]